MIRCPVCQSQEMEGVLFCTTCGADLTAKVSPPAAPEFQVRRDAEVPPPAPKKAKRAVENKLSRVALRVLETGQEISLDGIHELTLGRVSGNQPILPDIDLTQYKAYEGGVSRLHATIKVKPDQVFVSDLGSANGTRVNGKRLSAHTPHELADGDMLALGKLKLQLIIRSPIK